MKIALTVLLFFGSLSCFSQDKIDYFFVNMPDSIFPQLTKVNREDFIDFKKSNMKAEVTNRFGGRSEMQVLTDNFIKIKMSDSSTFQLKLLRKSKKKSIILLISTVHTTSNVYSSLSFYSSDWEVLKNTKFIKEPTIKDLQVLVDETKKLNPEFNSPSKLISTISPSVTVDSVANSLSFHYTNFKNLFDEDSKPITLDSLTLKYLWNKGKFRIQKK